MANKLVLPKTLKRELWEKLGSNPEWEKHIGKPMVSWSQIEVFNDKKGFNTGLLGMFEYFRKYFLGETYPDMGWGTFGTEAQEYIQERKHSNKFTPAEKEVLETIEPLDIFEQPVILDFGTFIVLGFIDGLSEDWTKMRDIKTKSESSKKDLFTGKKHQLELYSLFVEQEKGFLPECEYVIVEREGGRACMMGGGRDVLTVGERVWYEPYKITKARLAETKKLVKSTVKEISNYYQVFLKLNELK